MLVLVLMMMVVPVVAVLIVMVVTVVTDGVLPFIYAFVCLIFFTRLHAFHGDLGY